MTTQPGTPPAGRGPGSLERQSQERQLDAMWRLNAVTEAARGEVRWAADRVDPGFHAALETLRTADPIGRLPIMIKLRQLCPGR